MTYYPPFQDRYVGGPDGGAEQFYSPSGYWKDLTLGPDGERIGGTWVPYEAEARESLDERLKRIEKKLDAVIAAIERFAPSAR